MKAYTPYFGVETAGGRIGLVSCLKCGATITVGDKEFDAAKAHDEWHAVLAATPKQEGRE